MQKRRIRIYMYDILYIYVKKIREILALNEGLVCVCARMCVCVHGCVHVFMCVRVCV